MEIKKRTYNIIKAIWLSSLAFVILFMTGLIYTQKGGY